MSDTTKTDALQTINDIISSISFLRTLIETDKVSANDINTHLKLLHYSYDKLSVALGQDVLSAQLEETQAMLREANTRIRELECQLGNETKTDAAIAHIIELQKRFATWYSLSGFHYGSTSWKECGFYVEFSSEIQLPEDATPAEITFGDRALATKIQKLVPYAFTDADYDLQKDSFKNELLATDKNCKALQTLFTNTFPGSRILETISHHRNDCTTLHVKVFVPYSGIDVWYDNIVTTLKENPPRNGGKLYAQKAELEHNLNSKIFMTHAAPTEIEKVHNKKPLLYTITKLWDEFGDVPMNPETECIEQEWTPEWETDGKKQGTKFPAGTFREDIWHWFEETFHVSVAEDLMGIV